MTTASQDIVPLRKKYNQWVASQTLEDFALRFTAKSARRWSIPQVALMALGTTAFLALEAIGATVTLQYGFVNSVIAMVVVCLTIFVIGLPICLNAARYGVDIDLLSRGAGFGYLGSTITSLVYASFTFIFFAIEAAIMAVALQLLFAIPLSVAYVVSALVVIPLVTQGFTFMSRFQMGSQYLWLLLQVAAISLVALHDFDEVSGWIAYAGAAGTNSFDLLACGAAASVVIALIAQLGKQVDYLRFLPEQTSSNKKSWYAAVIMAGPGWVFVALVKLLLGSFIAYLLISGGATAAIAADPTHMYSHVYGYFHETPQAALVIAGLMVVLCQLKTNVTNAYAGSIAWSNFFSRLTHSHPGRIVWLVFNILIALLLMELGIYQVLEGVLGVFAISAVAWLTALATDLGINKPLGLSPRHIEFKRAHLYDVNPVGVGAMILATLVGVLCYLGTFGPSAQALTHFITMLIAMISTVAIAKLTRGQYYIARQSDDFMQFAEVHTCVICAHEYEHNDMAFCPAYGGAICSLCCSLDARCLDRCKTDTAFNQQLDRLLRSIFPAMVVAALFTQVGRFCVRFAIAAAAMAGVFSLAYFVLVERGLPEPGVASALWTLYFLLAIVVGIITWLFLLTGESRGVAHQESAQQTQRLMREIEAHEETDRDLQSAKETAEAASYAKTRYLSGISHEFRTPLQSILGYAQILKREDHNRSTRRAVEVIHRSGEHLSDLIEGLLDVSRIEAGRIELRSEAVRLPELLNQLTAIFKPIAVNKGIDLDVNLPKHLPTYVRTDPQRLRQILTNLLSNAVKFTQSGSVTFDVRYGSQVAEFRVRDTGPGIRSKDLDTIFIPFERGRSVEGLATVGTGLGLTIVKLLCDVMGGEVTVKSEPGVGSEFRVALYLPPTAAPVGEEPEARSPTGYEGRQRTLLVVDDDPVQRGLLSDVLSPLGFWVQEARDAPSCLDVIRSGDVPDLILLDVSMPGMSGIELSRVLRQKHPTLSIIMVSANADEPVPGTEDAYDHYLVKPIRLEVLLKQLADRLALAWTYDTQVDTTGVSAEIRDVLIHHAELGHASGFRQALEHALVAETISVVLAEQLFHDLDRVQFAEIIQRLKAVQQ